MPLTNDEWLARVETVAAWRAAGLLLYDAPCHQYRTRSGLVFDVPLVTADYETFANVALAIHAGA